MPFDGWQANTTSSLSISTPTGWTRRGRDPAGLVGPRTPRRAIKRKFGTPVIATADPDDLPPGHCPGIHRSGLHLRGGGAGSDRRLSRSAVRCHGEASTGRDGRPTGPPTPTGSPHPRGIRRCLVDGDGRSEGDPFGDLLADELEENLAVLEAAESAVGRSRSGRRRREGVGLAARNRGGERPRDWPTNSNPAGRLWRSPRFRLRGDDWQELPPDRRVRFRGRPLEHALADVDPGPRRRLWRWSHVPDRGRRTPAG